MADKVGRRGDICTAQGARLGNLLLQKDQELVEMMQLRETLLWFGRGYLGITLL